MRPDEHAADPFVRRARAEGWRSRAVFKLEEIDRRERLLRPGQVVIDLGAAPGAWSQYARRRVGRTGHVIAADILPMEPIAGVVFVEGDFREESVLEAILARLPARPARPVRPAREARAARAARSGDAAEPQPVTAEGPRESVVDVVLSDMAPNLSGIDAVDQPRSLYLAELALELAGRVLNEEGAALIKAFQGSGFQELVRTARHRFTQVKLVKPGASRARSPELYLLAKQRVLV
ncbi:MAG: RlmE family RNA methyltransferase [Steroidobacteraceae bacterium]